MTEQISPILVTGAGGFIGAAISRKLLANDFKVIGIDDLNDYYSKELKINRIRNICSVNKGSNKWEFVEGSIENELLLVNIFKRHKPKIVINLAAQAGVRYSLENPKSYINSNIVGFGNILELCRNFSVENLIYASSSSVYGGNKYLPYCEKQNVDHPISLYAATKRANELMAHSYSHLYRIPITGLRFFTVYGPWGRPDMAPMLFANAILNNEEILVYNNGKMRRDFTYIDDVSEVIYKCCYKPATVNTNNNSQIDSPDSSTIAPHRIFNVGNSQSINLLQFIQILEKELGVKAKMKFMPIQPGDVLETHANTSSIEEWIGYKPLTSLEQGLKDFCKWYLEFYKHKL